MQASTRNAFAIDIEFSQGKKIRMLKSYGKISY
jgi:hypothetical protein